MPQRDPSSGKFVSDSEELADDWSDYEIVNARFTAYTGGGTSGYQSSEDGWLAIDDDMIPGAQLGRSEMAELVHYQRDAVLYVEDFSGQDQLDRGHARGDWNVLINEEPETENMTNNVNDTAGSGTALEIRHYGGIVDSGVLATEPSIQDEANGLGAGGYTSHSTREVNFRQTLGSGPVVDRFDDIKFLSGIGESNVPASTTLEIEANMWFDVAEVEDTNPFGRA